MLNTPMKLLDGKVTAEKIRKRISDQTAMLVKNGNKPHLAAILIGNDGASETYIAAKVRACKEIGFDSTLIRFNEDVSEATLLDAIRKLNDDPLINGIIVQLPLPGSINEQKITQSIRADKDVDGFHPENLGRLMLGLSGFISATPRGIIMLLQEYGIETEGKHCVIAGRSNIVGTPLSLLMSRNANPGNSTVTLCHSKTINLSDYTVKADILVAALGKPGFIQANMVKEGAVVIDVGITRIKDLSSKKGYRISGDVDFQQVSPKASWITPVPGGVGAMTIAALMQNTLDAYTRQTGK